MTNAMVLGLVVLNGTAKSSPLFFGFKGGHDVVACPFASPGLQVYPKSESDRRHREEASTSTPRWLPTDLGNGIKPRYR